MQGRHDCLHLPTNRVVTCATVTPIPITAGVMVQVATMANQERMPTGLKIINRYQVVLYDSTWIPGVDFEDSDYDSEDDDYTTDDNLTTSSDETDSNDDDDDDYDEFEGNYDELGNEPSEKPSEEPSG